MKIEPGIYKHWKGGEYEVLLTAINRDSGEERVIYRKKGVEVHPWEHKTVQEFTETITRVLNLDKTIPGKVYTGPRYWLLVSNAEGPK